MLIEGTLQSIKEAKEFLLETNKYLHTNNPLNFPSPKNIEISVYSTKHLNNEEKVIKTDKNITNLFSEYQNENPEKSLIYYPFNTKPDIAKRIPFTFSTLENELEKIFAKIEKTKNPYLTLKEKFYYFFTKNPNNNEELDLQSQPKSSYLKYLDRLINRKYYSGTLYAYIELYAPKIAIVRNKEVRKYLYICISTIYEITEPI